MAARQSVDCGASSSDQASSVSTHWEANPEDARTDFEPPMRSMNRTFFLPGEVIYTQIPDAWIKLPQPYSIPIYDPTPTERSDACSDAVCDARDAYGAGGYGEGDRRQNRDGSAAHGCKDTSSGYGIGNAMSQAYSSSTRGAGIVATFRNIFRMFGSNSSNSNSNSNSASDSSPNTKYDATGKGNGNGSVDEDDNSELPELLDVDLAEQGDAFETTSNKDNEAVSETPDTTTNNVELDCTPAEDNEGEVPSLEVNSVDLDCSRISETPIIADSPTANDSYPTEVPQCIKAEDVTVPKPAEQVEEVKHSASAKTSVTPISSTKCTASLSSAKMTFEYLPGTMLITNYRVLFLGPPVIKSLEVSTEALGKNDSSDGIQDVDALVGVERLCVLDLPVGALAGTGVDRSACWSSLHRFTGDVEVEGDNSVRNHCWAASWDSATKNIDTGLWKRLIQEEIRQGSIASPLWRRGPGGLICLEHGKDPSKRNADTSVGLSFRFADQSRLLPILPASFLLDTLTQLVKNNLIATLKQSINIECKDNFENDFHQSDSLASFSLQIARQILHSATTRRVASTSASSTLNALISSANSSSATSGDFPNIRTKSCFASSGKLYGASSKGILATSSLWIPVEASNEYQPVVYPSSYDGIGDESEYSCHVEGSPTFSASSSYPFGHFGSSLVDRLEVSIPDLTQICAHIEKRCGTSERDSASCTNIDVEDCIQSSEESCVEGTIWGPAGSSFKSLSSMHSSSEPNLSSIAVSQTLSDNSKVGTGMNTTDINATSSPSSSSLDNSTTSVSSEHATGNESPRSDVSISRKIASETRSLSSSDPRGSATPSLSRLARLALCSKVPIQAGLPPSYYLTGGFHKPVSNLTQIQPINVDPLLSKASEFLRHNEKTKVYLEEETTFSMRPRTTANNVTSSVNSIPSLTLSVVEIIFRSPSSTFVDSLCTTLERLNRSVLPVNPPAVAISAEDADSEHEVPFDEAINQEKVEVKQICDSNADVFPVEDTHSSADSSMNKTKKEISNETVPRESFITKSTLNAQTCFAQQHTKAISLIADSDSYLEDLRSNFGWAVLDPIVEAVRTKSLSLKSAVEFLESNFGIKFDDNQSENSASELDIESTEAKSNWIASSTYIEPLKGTHLISGKMSRTKSIAKCLYTRLRMAHNAILDSNSESAVNCAQLRVSSANLNYELCSSYPPVVLAPQGFSDAKLIEAASFRMHNRLPIPAWRHPRTGALLLRASQPRTGFASRSSSDEALVDALVTASNDNPHSLALTQMTTIPPSAENAFIRSEFVGRGWTSDQIEKFMSQPDAMEKLMMLGSSSIAHNDSEIKSSDDKGEQSHRSNKQGLLPRLAIFDCRYSIAAWGNAVMGGGFEKAELYCGGASFSFLDIPNIHSVSDAANSAVLNKQLHKSYNSSPLNGLSKESPQSVVSDKSLVKQGGLGVGVSDKMTPELHPWYDAVLSVLKGASLIASALACGTSVLVHCSDNVDRTTQVSFLAQIMLDERFRTLNGICLLLEKEWVLFGHRFRERAGLDEDGLKNKLSPVFAQAMDCLFQLIRMFPSHFEFNEVFLMELIHSVYSGRFGAFMFNRHQDLVLAHAHTSTISPWSHFLSDSVRGRYISPSFKKVDSSSNAELKQNTRDEFDEGVDRVHENSPGVYISDSKRLAFVLKREQLVPWKALLYPGWGWRGFASNTSFEDSLVNALGLSLHLERRDPMTATVQD